MQKFLSTQKNFAEARNFGLNKSKGEWILYIDADERISADLVHEIKQELVINSAYNAYKIRRVNYYLGKVWPHQEMLERLFKKSTLLSWSGKVHESARVQGDIGQLKNHLIHYTHRNLFEMVQNTIVWSEIEAKLRFDAGHPLFLGGEYHELWHPFFLIIMFSKVGTESGP